MSQVPGQDTAFMESISKHMRVPERLSVGLRRQWRDEGEEEEEAVRRFEDRLPAVTMQIPDRLTYTEAPDMSPTTLFSPSKLTVCGPLSLDHCWETPTGEVFMRDALQSPIRRSYSDQSFGKTPPGTPTHLKQTLSLPRHPSSLCSRGSSHLPLHRFSHFTPTCDPVPPPSSPPSLQFAQSFLQTAKQLGLKASHRLLQVVSHKYRLSNQAKPPSARPMAEAPVAAQVELSKRRMMDSWSTEEEGGAAVEFIILRRQVLKMSRRLAALERHSADRRNTELVLFSLLMSACLLNMWLWIRR